MADMGFVRKKQDIASEESVDLQAAVEGIKPRAPASQASISEVRQIADKAGFPSREYPEPVRRTKAIVEPTQATTLRLPISVVRQFADFADAHGGLSYPKALALLLKREADRSDG